MKKTLKIITWLFIIVAIVGGFVFYKKNKKPITTYTTADVSKATLIQTVSVTGEINPQVQFDLAFKTSGILDKVAAVGSQVQADKEIASLEKRSLYLQYQQSQQDIVFQQKTLSAMKNNDDNYSKQQISAQKALVMKSQIAQNLSKQNINDASIFAPIDGIVISSNFEPGEMVNAGATVMSVITKELVIDSKIPESDIVKLALGQHARITFDALNPEDVFDAQLIQIDPASTTIQDVVYYKVKLKLNNADSRIKPGMSANIDIATAEKNDAIIAPLRAIKTEEKRKFVEVLQTDNTTKKVYVETGLEGDDGMVEIKSGLSGGEKVVTFSSTK